MANGDLEEQASGTPPPPDPNADAGGPGGGGPPPGGGPNLAMIARSRQGPQPSAPGPGDQANSMQKLMSAIGLIQQAAMGLAPGSPLWKDAMDSAKRLGRHLPQGAPTVGVQRTGIMDLLKQIGQSGFLQQIMGSRGGGPPGPGGGGGQEAMPQPPAPSMPLPGA